MNDEYLWDKTGPPDLEIQQLEELLRPWAAKPSTLRLITARRRWTVPLAIAATVLVAALALTIGMRSHGPSWTLRRNSKETLLRSGDWLDTGRDRAWLNLDSFGQLEVAPDSRLRVAKSASDRQQFSLARGSVHATIWAPPGQFSMSTPSATAVDLGCSYTLTTDANGNGLVHVDAGWVAFEANGRESFIPQGAECRTRPALGPGVPYFPESSDKLRAFVDRFDESARLDGLDTALAAARPDDAMTLWHLLRRVPSSSRDAVFTRFAVLHPAPNTVAREAIVRGDPRALDALWDSLDYGDTGWWRAWKQHER